MKSLLNLLQEEDSIINSINNTEQDIHDYKREGIGHETKELYLERLNDKLSKHREQIKQYLSID